MDKDYSRFNIKIYDVQLARRFKARLALDGLTYRGWLADEIKGYLKAKPASARAAAPKSKTTKSAGTK